MSVAASLARQRLLLEPIDLEEALKPADEDAAYRLQAEVNQELAEKLGSLAGYKIGCTTPVMQAFLGIPNPCAGEVFANTVLHGEGKVSRRTYRRLGIECELVVELAEDIAPGGAPFTRDTVADAVGAVMAGIEIVDDRYRDYRALGVPTLIADNFFNAGCVLGDPFTDWRRLDLGAIEGRTLINGAEAGRGNGAMVLGHPLEALAWLANSRAGRGQGLERGRFVFLGSLVETKWLQAGDTARIAVEGLGDLTISVTA
jgi:2-oxo-3-hexenedioate decarboxylase/2-keto-4-pentenoate hydratase